MSRWQIIGQLYKYQGGADRSATIAYGYRVDCRRDDGVEAKVNVELVDGARVSLTASQARRLIDGYLNGDELPSRIVVDRDGNAQPVWSAAT